LHRAQPFEFQFDPVVIVIVDIVSDAVFEAVDILERVRMEELGFEDSEEAFHGSIVETVSLA
jgi:hypothetical protein